MKYILTKDFDSIRHFSITKKRDNTIQYNRGGYKMNNRKNKNILLINHYAGDPNKGMEFRPYYLAKEWVKMGHNVHILAADFSHLRLNNPVITKDFDEKIVDGIHYHWVKTNKYNGNGLKRALTMFQFVGKLLFNAKKIVKEIQPNVVITSSTYPLDTYAGQRIAKLSGAKLIHEVHDMWPSTLYEIGGMSKYNPFVMLLQLAENSAYRNCETLVSLLPNTKDYMIKHGLNADKFVNIQNGVSLEEWNDSLPLPSNVEDKLSRLKRSKFIVGYFGGHALSNALNILLDVATNINDDNIAFVLVGDGVEKASLIDTARKRNLKNVHFFDSLNKKAIPNLLKYFDCSFMGGYLSPLYRFGVSLNKMFDSMIAGVPIIFSFTAEKTIVEEYNVGYVVDSEDVNGIIESIYKIKEMDDQEKKMLKDRAKKVVLDNFTFEKLAKRFSDFF